MSQTLTQALTERVGQTEAVTRGLTYTQALTERVGQTETLTQVLTYTLALTERVGQTEALTQVLIERVGPTNRGGLGSSSVLAQLLRTSVWAARLAGGKKSNAAANAAEELRLLRSEVEELACRLDVLLLEAGA